MFVLKAIAHSNLISILGSLALCAVQVIQRGVRMKAGYKLESMLQVLKTQWYIRVTGLDIVNTAYIQDVIRNGAISFWMWDIK